MTPGEVKDAKDIFYRANYFWIFISLIFGFLSHISRAIRWRYLLEPLGYKPSLKNSYHSTMIGYIFNLALPRAGEPSRAVYLSKYEKVPFEKGFGTIFAERVIDLLMLGLIFCIAVIFQWDVINNIRNKALSAENPEVDGGEGSLWWKLLIGIVILVIGLFVILKNKKIKNKLWELGKGFFDGLKTVFQLKNKWAFIFHTFFIWTMYIAMFGICLLVIPETSSLGMGAVLAGFIAGTIGVVLVQGGLGLYPGLVGGVLFEFYAVDAGVGQGLGWLIWITQTALIVFLGGLSLILISRNKSTDISSEQEPENKAETSKSREGQILS